MKKYFVSAVVVIGFVAYSAYQRVFGAQAVPVIAPKNISSSPSATLQSTPTETPTRVPPTATVTPAQAGKSQSSPTNTPTPTPHNTPTPTQKPSSQYKDGTFTGDAADAFYGNIQVQVTIANGKLTNVQFLQAPSDRSTSVAINQQADPMLAQEAIQAQSANVNIVSGATDSSQAFVQSLQSALNKAKS